MEREAIIKVLKKYKYSDLNIGTGDLPGEFYINLVADELESQEPEDRTKCNHERLTAGGYCAYCGIHKDYFIPPPDSKEENTKEKDISITLLQTLYNATGAEFEDEELAVSIISETIKRYCESKEEETILVDDPNYPNIGRKMTKKDFKAQLQEQPDKAEEILGKYKKHFRIISNWCITLDAHPKGKYTNRVNWNNKTKIANIFPLTQDMDYERYIYHEILHICQAELKRGSIKEKKEKEELFIVDLCRLFDKYAKGFAASERREVIHGFMRAYLTIYSEKDTNTMIDNYLSNNK